MPPPIQGTLLTQSTCEGPYHSNLCHRLLPQLLSEQKNEEKQTTKPFLAFPPIIRPKFAEFFEKTVVLERNLVEK